MKSERHRNPYGHAVPGARGHIAGRTDAAGFEARAKQLPAHETALWNRLRAAFLEQAGCPEHGLVFESRAGAASSQAVAIGYQVLNPPATWNWPPANSGFISAAQYDFCATMPQWSVQGTYVSSGVTFDGAYQQFLNLVVLAATDPVLQQQIQAAQNNVLTASVKVQQACSRARGAYDATVKGNDPTYTHWLTGDGERYGRALTLAMNDLKGRQVALDRLLAEQQTPHIAAAQASYVDPANYLALTDSGLFGLPPVPAWNVSATPQQWLADAQAGDIPNGSIVFSSAGLQRLQSTDQPADPADAFWAVHAGGEWQHAPALYTDAELSCSIDFAALDTVSITPAAWYSGTLPFENGPFYWNITPTKEPDSQFWMFGQGGLVPLMKTGMRVSYGPQVTIVAGESTFETLSRQAPDLRGIQVGSDRR